MKTQIGLGVLSIPLNFDVLGMIPGVICLLIIGGITTWSDYMVGVFKMNHREVYGIDDVGQLIAGRPGRYLMAAVFVLCEYNIDRTDHNSVSNAPQSGSSVPAPACWAFLSPLTLYPHMALAPLSSSPSRPLQVALWRVSRHSAKSVG